MEFITGSEWRHLFPKEQEKYIEDAFIYWRKRGFPYRYLSNKDICNLFKQIVLSKSKNIFFRNYILTSNNIGLALANYFHPQMWGVTFYRHRSPMDCFINDQILRNCIKKALLLWPDRKGAGERCLRDILRTYHHTRRVSNFRPMVAKAIIEKYSQQGDRILDFSAGYGGRLLGCLAADRHYVGFDPCKAQVRGLINTYKVVSKNQLTQATAEIRCVCAEEEMENEERSSYKLVFTSPPYFDREHYSSEKTQSYIRYPTYIEWKEKFLRKVIDESYRIIKRDGYLILNVSNIKNAPIADDTEIIACKKFEISHIYKLRLTTLPFNRSKSKIIYHNELLYVFKKG